MKIVASAPAARPPLLHPDTEEPAVSLEKVVKKYRDQTVLHRVSLKIRQGEFLTLLGPSGCGKTTLLNLIAGFAEADGGEIFIDGEPVTTVPPHLRKIGIVFQNYALFPHMTVERNIGYGLRMRNVPKDEIARRVQEAMALVKLEGLGQRKPRELSGGQQQRVALARALVIEPKVLLLDEPFSALDKSLRASMQVEIREIQRRLGVTTIFVTHDQGEAMAMSDRIAVMSAGRIRQIDTPSELYRNPQDPFVASFLGDVNILPGYYHRQKGDTIQIRIGSALLDMPRSRIVGGIREGLQLDVYVRPENMQLHSVGNGALLTGTVVNHVFQGDHIITYVDTDLPVAGRRVVKVRSAGLQASEQWPVGTVVGISFPGANASAYEPQE